MTPAAMIAMGMSPGLVQAITNGENTDPALASLATVGAGTLTAALIAGGIVTRDGAQSATAFTDTTATAALIVAGITNAKIAQGFLMVYKNNTDGAATLAAGSGVTLAGQTVIPANSWGLFLVKLTSLTAVAITGIAFGNNVPLPLLKRVAITANTSTLSAGDMEGADACYLNVSGQATPTFTTRTGTELAAAIPGIQIGFKYVLRVVSTNSGTTTMAGGSGVTISGTATVATNTWREFLMAYTAANTWTMTSIGTGTNS